MYPTTCRVWLALICWWAGLMACNNATLKQYNQPVHIRLGYTPDANVTSDSLSNWVTQRIIELGATPLIVQVDTVSSKVICTLKCPDSAPDYDSKVWADRITSTGWRIHEAYTLYDMGSAMRSVEARVPSWSQYLKVYHNNPESVALGQLTHVEDGYNRVISTLQDRTLYVDGKVPLYLSGHDQIPPDNPQPDLFALDPTPVLQTTDADSVTVVPTNSGWAVRLHCTPAGGRTLAYLTRSLAVRQGAIGLVINGEVAWTPRVRGAIEGGFLVIGTFQRQETAEQWKSRMVAPPPPCHLR
jgi:hypothetical protein